jgi:hypothetical protein
MVIPEKFKTVTKTSRIIALIFFVLLPFIGFALGITYEKIVLKAKESEELSLCLRNLTNTNTPIKTFKNTSIEDINEEIIKTDSPINELPSQDIEGLLNLLIPPINWSEYSNEQCGFSIKYPDFLKIYESNCEVAFYYGETKPPHSFCPLIHLVINNESCGSLAYKGTAQLSNTTEIKIRDTNVNRYDYSIDNVVLESSFDNFNIDGSKISLNYYNGGKTLEQANEIRELFDQMVLSIKPDN